MVASIQDPDETTTPDGTWKDTAPGSTFPDIIQSTSPYANGSTEHPDQEIILQIPVADEPEKVADDILESAPTGLNVPTNTADDFLILEWDSEQQYNLTGPSRGKVVIIQVANYSQNLTKYFGISARPEAETDGRDLTFRLRHAGLSVQLVKDPSRDDLLDLIAEETTASKNKLENVPCFMLIIMTHAVLLETGRPEVFAMHDDFVSGDELIAPFATCEALIGKPKIFILQASRSGKVESDVITMFKRKAPSVEANVFLTPDQLLLHPDMLIVRSTVPDYFSFKNVRSGSRFLQYLCKAFDFNVVNPQIDLVTLISRVNGQLATYTSQTAAHEGVTEAGRLSAALAKHRKRHVVTWMSTLTKEICLYS